MRRDRLGTILILVCLVGMTWFVYSTEQRLSSQQRTLGSQQSALARDAKRIGSQHAQLVQGCVRLNILRAEDNVSHYADFRVFRVANALPLTPELKSQLTIALRVKAWTPLTDCRLAVARNGVRYRAPRPITFVRRLPPRMYLYPPRHGSALLGG